MRRLGPILCRAMFQTSKSKVHKILKLLAISFSENAVSPSTLDGCGVRAALTIERLPTLLSKQSKSAWNAQSSPEGECEKISGALGVASMPQELQLSWGLKNVDQSWLRKNNWEEDKWCIASKTNLAPSYICKYAELAGSSCIRSPLKIDLGPSSGLERFFQISIKRSK